MSEKRIVSRFEECCDMTAITIYFLQIPFVFIFIDSRYRLWTIVVVFTFCFTHLFTWNDSIIIYYCIKMYIIIYIESVLLKLIFSIYRYIVGMRTRFSLCYYLCDICTYVCNTYNSFDTYIHIY